MNTSVNAVALRYRAIYLDVDRNTLFSSDYKATAPMVAMAKRLAESGYTLSEELMHALATMPIGNLVDTVTLIEKTYGLRLNWLPLVRGWDTPTGESVLDHIITAFANMKQFMKASPGVVMPCGHVIPDGTFPIERYNGCPFCGKPFDTDNFVYTGQGSKLTELRLFTTEDMLEVFNGLLTSSVPLDATQMDSLKIMAEHFDIPWGLDVRMKETRMVVIDALIKKGKESSAASYFSTPTDVLRYLWYRKTGKAIIIRPKNLISAAGKWSGIFPDFPHNIRADHYPEKMKNRLKLKYDRIWCRRVALWMNDLPMSAEAAAENMHPYRGMWVRFIRALRLAEYSKKPGLENLARLMDVFYNQTYEVWNGRLTSSVVRGDMESVLTMLSSRPGFFARSLFATMLRFGAEPTLNAFRKVAKDVPSRLLFSLTNAAELYFDPKADRYAYPITGGQVKIAHNQMMSLYSADDLRKMTDAVKVLFLDAMHERYSQMENGNKTAFIHPSLFDIPVAVGDRTTSIQDASVALQGTRFHVEGDSVRLFIHWGEGMKAQHLDMDLSCRIIYDKRRVDCSYYNLNPTGARHSGDIRDIPDKVGAAEYVELNLPVLQADGAKYVFFSCNSYSCGTLPSGMKFGWMNSENEMKISEKTGVAYDPSCVQHLVRVGNDNLAKGIVFGVLDIAAKEITWLDMPDQNQGLFMTGTDQVMAMLERLRQKCSLGTLLSIKAKAQNLEIIDDESVADEVYSYQWAQNPANVGILLE